MCVQGREGGRGQPVRHPAIKQHDCHCTIKKGHTAPAPPLPPPHPCPRPSSRLQGHSWFHRLLGPLLPPPPSRPAPPCVDFSSGLTLQTSACTSTSSSSSSQARCWSDSRSVGPLTWEQVRRKGGGAAAREQVRQRVVMGVLVGEKLRNGGEGGGWQGSRSESLTPCLSGTKYTQYRAVQRSCIHNISVLVTQHVSISHTTCPTV